MGTLFHSDNSGVLALLIGMIALVMFGVAITLLMDGSLSLSGWHEDHQSVIDDQSARIVELEAEHKLLTLRQEGREELAEHVRRLDEVSEMLGAESARMMEARVQLQAESRGFEVLRQTFAEYRDQYRRERWLAASGRTLGELTSRAGRTYKGVRIKSLNATEMVIEHDGGSGRLPIAELPNNLLEEYQLDVREADRLVSEAEEHKAEQLRLLAESRAEARRAEEEERLRMEEIRSRTGQPTEEDLAAEEEKQKESRLLRIEINGMHESLTLLQREVAEARARIGGRERSPAGSLETWEERHRRLALRAEQARVILHAKVDRMQELDPLYHPPYESPGRPVR